MPETAAPSFGTVTQSAVRIRGPGLTLHSRGLNADIGPYVNVAHGDGSIAARYLRCFSTGGPYPALVLCTLQHRYPQCLGSFPHRQLN